MNQSIAQANQSINRNRYPEMRDHVDFHALFNLLVRRVEKPLSINDSCIINQQWDVPHVLSHFLSRFVHLIPVRHVAKVAPRLTTVLFNQRPCQLQPRRVNIPQDHFRAQFGQFQRDQTPDSTSCTGDQCDFAINALCCPETFWNEKRDESRDAVINHQENRVEKFHNDIHFHGIRSKRSGKKFTISVRKKMKKCPPPMLACRPFSSLGKRPTHTALER